MTSSRPPRSVPTLGNQEAPFVTLGTGPYQADSLFEGIDKAVFGSVINLDLFIVAGMLEEPVVRHFSGDKRWLPLVATADALDIPTLEPVEKGFQGGAEHCADLDPDDYTGNEFLLHIFGRPL